MYAIKPLKFNTYKSLIGYKVVAYDLFGNEFARIDLERGEDINSLKVIDFIHNKQRDYEEKIMGAFSPKGSFVFGNKVEKKSGSWWEGNIVGWYSTEQTPVGYAVQLSSKLNGAVQIYPESALKRYEQKLV